MRIAFYVVLGLSPFLLSACATMTKEECIAADWRVVGEADGARGHDPQQRFAAHAKSCKRANIVPDQTLWHQGYQLGLKRYCTPLNGLSEGQAGRPYHKVCPSNIERGFLNGYGLGKKHYDLKSRLSSLDWQSSAKKKEIDELSDRLRAASGAERRELRADIDDLESDLRDIRRQIGRAESDLAHIERDIEWFRQNPDAPVPLSLN